MGAVFNKLFGDQEGAQHPLDIPRTKWSVSPLYPDASSEVTPRSVTVSRYPSGAKNLESLKSPPSIHTSAKVDASESGGKLHSILKFLGTLWNEVKNIGSLDILPASLKTKAAPVSEQTSSGAEKVHSAATIIYNPKGATTQLSVEQLKEMLTKFNAGKLDKQEFSNLLRSQDTKLIHRLMKENSHLVAGMDSAKVKELTTFLLTIDVTDELSHGKGHQPFRNEYPGFSMFTAVLLNAKSTEGMKGKAQGVIAHHAGAIAQIKGIPKIGATPEQQKLLDDFEGKAEAFSGELLDGIISSLQNLDISEAQNLAKEFKALINNKDPEHNAVKQPDRFIVGIYIFFELSHQNL